MVRDPPSACIFLNQVGTMLYFVIPCCASKQLPSGLIFQEPQAAIDEGIFRFELLLLSSFASATVVHCYTDEFTFSDAEAERLLCSEYERFLGLLQYVFIEGPKGAEFEKLRLYLSLILQSKLF